MSREAHGPCFSMASFFFKASANLVSTARVKIKTGCVFFCVASVFLFCVTCVFYFLRNNSLER